MIAYYEKIAPYLPENDDAVIVEPIDLAPDAGWPSKSSLNAPDVRPRPRRHGPSEGSRCSIETSAWSESLPLPISAVPSPSRRRMR